MAKKGKNTIAVRKYRMMLVGLLLVLIMLFAFYIFSAGQKNKRIKDATLVKKEAHRVERKA